MKYSYRIAIILASLLLFLNACSSRPSRVSWNIFGKYEPYAEQISASVPYLNIPGYGTSLDYIQIIEKDSYGRILFVYQTESGMLDSKKSTDLLCIAICQQTKKQYVYFYEDICYLIAPGNINDYDAVFSEENFTTLKNLNDWNCPKDESKMTKVRYQGKEREDIASCTVSDYMKETRDRVNIALCKYLEISDSDTTIFYYCFATDTSIWVASVRTASNEKPSLYIFNYSSNIGITAAQELKDPMNCQEQISDFKKEHGASCKTERLA